MVEVVEQGRTYSRLVVVVVVSGVLGWMVVIILVVRVVRVSEGLEVEAPA